MDNDTKLELVEAVNVLIRSPRAHDLYQLMLTASPLLARHKELALVGEAAPLNRLAKYKVSHPDTYASIIGLVEAKREAAGFTPLVQAVEERFDKSAYMQQFMQQKRERQRRAADIENLQRSERDKLVGRSRVDFMQRQSAIWKTERDAMLNRAKEAAKPRPLKKEEIDLVVDSFWQKVDARLDELEALARSGKHAARDAMSLADLEQALKHDPYK